ncbi:MAG: site-2 protease family protein, partial [Archangium sp.]
AFVGRFDRPVALTVEREGKQNVFQVTPVKKIDTSVTDTVERGQIGIAPYNRVPVVGVPPGSPAAQAGLKTFDRILKLNGVNIPDEATLYEQLAKVEGPLNLTVQRMGTVEVGAVTGRVPSILPLTVPKQAGEGLAKLGGAEPVDMYVAVIAPKSAADQAGLHSGDRLLSFQGKPLQSFNLLITELSKQKEQPFQLSWRSAADGQEHTQQVAQATLTTKDEYGQEHSTLALGVGPWQPTQADVFAEDKVTVHLGPLAALRESAIIVPDIVRQMGKVILGLVSGRVSPKTLGGPVMMYQLASKSAEKGLDYFLNLMAVISINLGVMNLLPIPILDGFHLLSAFWEGIRRRPIPVRVREVANVVGLILLVALMGMAFFNDITR